MNVSGTWTNMKKSILVICFSFGAWHEGVRWGEGSTNIVQEDKNVSCVGFYLSIHLGTHFLLFKYHHNSSHETHLPKKDQHGFIFQLTQVCAAHRSHYRLYLFLPLLLFCLWPSSWGEAMWFIPHSRDKCPIWQISLCTPSPLPRDAHGEPWLVTILRSFLFWAES